MRIYLDTNLWNASYDEGIDPGALLEALDKLGAVPVLGQHVVFELLKTFTSKSQDAKNRGLSLFKHLESYLKAGLRTIAKDPTESLVAEMYALKGIEGAEKFLDSTAIANMTREIERLASGEIKDVWFEHIQEQAQSSEADRKRFGDNLSVNRSLYNKLRNIPKADLRGWLKSETYSVNGQRLLYEYLAGRFPNEVRSELQQYAVELLKSNSLMAEAIVRAGLYFNWRCAHHSSLRKDLLDDMYHVCNAAYCHVYASKEKKQTDYASHLLQSGTEIQIFQPNQTLIDWLCTIARRHRNN